MRIIGLAGWSGAGKTTLLSAVIPLLRERGLSVSTVKHAHHDFDLDQPGKDSWRHREAGAQEVLIASNRRFAVLHELRDEPEQSLPQLLSHLAPVDLVIVEGFKSEPYAKIEVYRTVLGKGLMCADDPAIRGLAADVRQNVRVPQAHLDDHASVAAMMMDLAMPLAEVVRGFAGSGRA